MCFIIVQNWSHFLKNSQNHKTFQTAFHQTQVTLVFSQDSIWKYSFWAVSQNVAKRILVFCHKNTNLLRVCICKTHWTHYFYIYPHDITSSLWYDASSIGGGVIFHFLKNMRTPFACRKNYIKLW